MFGSGGSGVLIAGTAQSANSGNAYFQYVDSALIPLNSDNTFEYSGDLLQEGYFDGGEPYSYAISSGSQSSYDANILTVTTWNIPMSDATTMSHFAESSQLNAIDFSNVSGSNITNWDCAFYNAPIEGELDLSMFSNTYLLQVSFNQTFVGCQATTIRTPLVQSPKTTSNFVNSCPNLERLYLGSEDFWTNSWESSGFTDTGYRATSEFHDCPKLVEIYLGKMNISTDPAKLLLCANYLYNDFVLDTEAIDSTYEIKTIRRHEMISVLPVNGASASTMDTEIKYYTSFSSAPSLTLNLDSGGNKFHYGYYRYDAYKEQNSQSHLITPEDEFYTEYHHGATSFASAFEENDQILAVYCSLNLNNCKSFSTAFSNCSKLAQVHFYNPYWYSPGFKISAAEAGDVSCVSMFEGSSLLWKVTMFNMQYVTDCSRMFYSCSNLEEVIIPCSNIKVWDYAFSGCTKLTNLKFVDYYSNGDWDEFDQDWAYGATSFEGVFEDCESLTEIKLNFSSSTTNLNISNCFKNCSSLTTITFLQAPNLDSTSTDVFAGCTSLELINCPGSASSTAHKAITTMLTQSGLSYADHYGSIEVIQ